PGYADCMTGTSSDVAFADAHVKGVALPDPRSAYESGLRNATVAPPFLEVGRTGNERAVFTGYVDTDTPESVSWALEAHINDHGLAAQAELLAEAPDTAPEERRQLQEEAAYLRARSANYPLLFDGLLGFFQGRRRTGGLAQSRTAGTSPSTSPTTGRGWPHCTGAATSCGRSWTSSSPPRSEPTSRAPTVTSSTRWTRPAQCGWASSGCPTSPRTTSPSSTTMRAPRIGRWRS